MTPMSEQILIPLMDPKKKAAVGSGNSIQEVNRFIKQFEDMKKMMRKMQGGGNAKMLRSMMKSR